MERLSSFVLAHRRWVFAFWVVMFVAGIAAAGAVPNRLSYDFSLPGQQGYETEQKIIASYQGANAQAAYIPVVTVPEGQTITGSAADVQAVYDALRKIPTVRVVDYSQTKDKGFITSDGRTTFGIIYEPQPNGFVDPNQKLIEDTFNAQLKQHGFTGGLTGYAAARLGRRRQRWAERARRDAARGARRPCRARVRLRLAPRARPAPHRRGLDPHDVPHRAAPHGLHRRELRRAVPHRPGRAGRGDRLLAARGLPVA